MQNPAGGRSPRPNTYRYGLQKTIEKWAGTLCFRRQQNSSRASLQKEALQRAVPSPERDSRAHGRQSQQTFPKKYYVARSPDIRRGGVAELGVAEARA